MKIVIQLIKNLALAIFGAVMLVYLQAIGDKFLGYHSSVISLLLIVFWAIYISAKLINEIDDALNE